MIQRFNKSYSEVLDEIRSRDKIEIPTINISVLRNITLEPFLDTFLKYFLLQIGYKLNIKFGQYDNVFQEAVSGNPDILNETTDYILVFLHLETFSNRLCRNYAALEDNEIEDEKNRIINYIERVLGGIRIQTKAVILWCGFETPVFPLGGILHSQSNLSQTEAINNLNSQIKIILNNTENAYFIDINLCLARLGYSVFYDKRLWYAAHAPYSKEACKELSFELFKYIKTLKGKSKKCIILDCDNVLWGGVYGEDSLSGIKLGRTYPGLIYYDFQQAVLNLYYCGIIIAICSKNNEEDVWKVFRKHPDMALREEHVSAYRINWENKAMNIKSIADELNIGLDSIVFIDDSEHEINLVNQMLPQVETILFDINKGYINRDIIACSGLFDVLHITNEDKLRGKMYKSEIQRNNFLQGFIDINSYYNSLEMVVSIYNADSFYIPRIAQLTQRTNQFNLTTKRYTEDDIKKFVDSIDSDIICLHLQDRFGDFGIVGSCIIKYIDDTALIDTFLLSCRVLGKKVEDVFLMEVIRLAKLKGKKTIIGQYIPADKNAQVKNFYQDRGFSIRQVDSDGSIISIYDLDSIEYSIPSFFKKVVRYL